jgi:ribokinase
MREPKVVVGFSGNLEFLVHLDGPHHSEKADLRSFEERIGGTSVNLGFSLGALGVPAHLIITTGMDKRADYIQEALKRHSLSHTMLSCRVETSFGYVRIALGGQRGIDSYKTAYARFPAAEVAEIVRRESPTAVVATGCTIEEEPLISAMFSAAPNDCICVLNPRESLCRDRGVLQRLLEYADILCINEGEYEARAGRDSRSSTDFYLQVLHGQGPEIIIVTKAGQGALISDRSGRSFHVEAYRAGEVVDETGAGDAFLAGFLREFLLGRDLHDCAEVARRVAGIKVTKLGGSNVATSEEINKHCNSITAVW